MTDYEQLRGIVMGFIDETTTTSHSFDEIRCVEGLRSRVMAMVPAAEKPKREAEKFVEWFNREFRRKFTVNDTTTKLVRSLMVHGHTQEEIRMVALYLKHRWEGDPKMHDYLVPSTILTALKFGERLDMAREWWGDR